MDWNSRASKVETRLRGLSRWKHWKTRDGKYRVSECRWVGSTKMPVRYYACILIDTPAGEMWDTISKHRKWDCAVAACEKHAARAGRPNRRKAA